MIGFPCPNRHFREEYSDGSLPSVSVGVVCRDCCAAIGFWSNFQLGRYLIEDNRHDYLSSAHGIIAGCRYRCAFGRRLNRRCARQSGSGEHVRVARPAGTDSFQVALRPAGHPAVASLLATSADQVGREPAVHNDAGLSGAHQRSTKYREYGGRSGRRDPQRQQQLPRRRPRRDRMRCVARAGC